MSLQTEGARPTIDLVGGVAQAIGDEESTKESVGEKASPSGRASERLPYAGGGGGGVIRGAGARLLEEQRFELRVGCVLDPTKPATSSSDSSPSQRLSS